MDQLNLKSAEKAINNCSEWSLLYDLKKDQMILSFENSDEQTVLNDYIGKFDFEKIHPADAELLIDVLRGLLVSPKEETLDIRSKRFQDSYEWYKLTLASKTDSSGHVTGLEGRMVKSFEGVADDSLIDHLTKVYNQRKMSQEIDSFLKEETQNEKIHAMFLLDLDNFGMVNRYLGQEAGDRILKECADILMQNFRRLDVVGRIGGDEFALFYKDAKSLFNIELLAEKLVKKLHWDLVYEEGTIHVSGSIGIAVFPCHGTTCEAMVMKAKDALLTAKANGKNGYHIFKSAETRLLLANSEQNKNLFRQDTTMDEMVMKMLGEGEERDVALRASMDVMLLSLNWHRGWILPSARNENSGIAPLFSCQEGYESGIFTKEESVRRIAIWEQLFEERKDFTVLCEYDVNDEELHRYMLERKIHRIIYYPFSIDGVYEGCTVLEECTDEHQPLEGEMLEQLKTCCRIIDTCAVQFRKDVHSMKDIIAKLQLIDNVDSYVCLVDLNDFTVKYVNRKVRCEFPEMKLGERCYPSVFSDRESCEGFLRDNMDVKDSHANCSRVMFDAMLRTWIKQSFSWFDSKPEHRVVMVMAIDISEYFIG